MNHFTGLMAAPFTPFDRKSNLNTDIIPAYVEKLVADGVKGIFVCGSNGEGPNMTVEERMHTAKAFSDVAAGRLKLFVHVGHTSIRESQKLAEHAVQIGADAISSVSAFYFKPGSAIQLIDALSELAAAAPAVPFYYYHIPHLTGVHMDMIEVLNLGKEKMPTFAGIKYTASTLYEYQFCKAYENSRFDILFGFDEMLLPALSVGARGFIGSTYNFAAPLYLDVVKSFEEKDIAGAQRKMLQLIRMVMIILRFPPIAAQKAIMKHLGFDLGPSRLPLPRLSAADESSLISQLDDIKFFDHLQLAKPGPIDS